jgi:hypothetical protein
MRLKGKPSHATMHDDIRLENGVTALPSTSRGEGAWKDIHVTREFEQRSVNEGRMSDDSQKDLYTGFAKK